MILIFYNSSINNNLILYLRHNTVGVQYCQVKSSHYYLYSAFNNANCVNAALHQLDIKLGGFTSALQYLDGEIVCRHSVILLLRQNQ